MVDDYCEQDETEYRMNITVVLFVLCFLLVTVLVATVFVRRFKKQLKDQMDKLKARRSSKSEKHPRFRKRDKIAFYGRKMLRKVAESVEQKKKLIPKKRNMMRSNTPTELAYLRREPSEYFLDPELAKLRSRGSGVGFILGGGGNGGFSSDELPMEMLYLLKSVRVFGYLERPLFLEICKFIETKHIASGLYLFNIGDPDDTIYVVQTGKIVVSIRHNDREWPVKEVTSGESIYSLLSFVASVTSSEAKEEKLKTVSARAATDTTVVKMPFSAFVPVFEKYPETMIRVIQVIMVRLQRVTFATLHAHLGLSGELLLPPNHSHNHNSSSQHAAAAAPSSRPVSKVNSAKELRRLARTNSQTKKEAPVPNSDEKNLNVEEAGTTGTGTSTTELNLSHSPTRKEKKKTKKKNRQLDLEATGSGAPSEASSRDASPSTRVKWSSVTFDPSAVNQRGTLLNNDEFNNVLGRARLDRLDSQSKPATNANSNSSRDGRSAIGEEPMAEQIHVYHPPVSPRQSRSHSLTYNYQGSGGVLSGNKLNKQDVTENVYIEAVHMFAKALGLPANKGHLLNDKLQLHSCNAGSVLLEQGSVDSSVILLLHGTLTVAMRNEDAHDATVYSMAVGEIVGTLPVLTGEPNLYSVKAKTLSRVVVLSKEYFYELMSEVPVMVLAVAKHIVSLISPFVRQSDFSLDWMQLEGGKSVYKQGEKSEAIYLVINGRLRSVWQTVGSSKKELMGEYGRGDLVGMVEVLTNKERKTSVHAVRDTELAVIPIGLLDFMKTRYPSMVARLIQILSHKMMSQHEELSTNTIGLLGAKTLSNISTIAIVPSNDSVPLTYFTLELLWALNAIGPAVRLTSCDIVNKFGDIAFDSVNDYKLSNYLSQVEDHHRIVLYQTDRNLSSWTQRCIRQADCIIILAVADQDPKVGDIEKQVDRMGVRAQKELVLLYRPNEPQQHATEGTHPMPKNTVHWLNNRDWCTMHHHLRCKNRTFSRKTPSKWLQHYSLLLSKPPDKHSDFSRLARHLTGTSVGLILGGGGARGAAHLGIIQALHENDIPIDMIGGTSIGSLVGALYAQFRHKPLNEFIARTRSWFLLMSSNLLKLFDLTYPHTSFFSGKIFNSQIYNVFEDMHIEDLWIPYFCVTTDITLSCIRIHTSGDIWRYVRSSMSLSGYLPPLCDPSDGHLLLDGGYVNNLPADIMKELWNPRRVIAVDVGSQDSQNLTNYGDYLSGWWVLWRKWYPFSRQTPIRVPGMEEIQSRLAYVLCKKQLEEVKNLAYCDYIRPPIDKYKTLSFGLFDEIFQLGYSHAATVFHQWVKANYMNKLLDVGADVDDTVFQNEDRKPSKKDNVDEFAQIASRLSRNLIQSTVTVLSSDSDSSEDDDAAAVFLTSRETSYNPDDSSGPEQEGEGEDAEDEGDEEEEEEYQLSHADTLATLPKQSSRNSSVRHRYHPHTMTELMDSSSFKASGEEQPPSDKQSNKQQ